MSSHIQSWKLGRAFSFFVGCSYVLLLNLPLFCAMCSPSARETGCIDYTRVIMYNKPCGEVTSIVSQDGHPTIFDSVERVMTAKEPRFSIKGFHSIGRLDCDTSGLLLLTNDTLLVHAATNPTAKVTLESKGGQFLYKKLEKEYIALSHGKLSIESLEKLRKGIYLGAKLGVTGPSKIEVLKNNEKSTLVSVVLTEGKNRQIRRMFHAVKSGIIKLHRNRVGGINIGELQEGECRYLRSEEIIQGLNWPIRSITDTKSNRKRKSRNRSRRPPKRT